MTLRCGHQSGEEIRNDIETWNTESDKYASSVNIWRWLRREPFCYKESHSRYHHCRYLKIWNSYHYRPSAVSCRCTYLQTV